MSDKVQKMSGFMVTEGVQDGDEAQIAVVDQNITNECQAH